MKNLTAMILALAILAGMTACKVNTNTPVNTTGTTTVTSETTETTTTTTVGDGASTSREETTETTAPAPTEEPFDAAAFLSTVPVYEYSYEDGKHLDCLDKIGAAEYKKYAAGEEFDEYFAIKFTDHPDIILIGCVVTEPGLKYTYEKRGIDSVIYNGKRYFPPKNDDATSGYRSFLITDDLICIASGTSLTDHAYFIYDGGTEYHTFPNGDIGNTLSYLQETDGVLKYAWYSTEYSTLHFTTPDFYGNFRSPDDHMYDEGTVELVDGKIKFISKSYTIDEWYAARTDLHEQFGTADVTEFIARLKEYCESNGTAM